VRTFTPLLGAEITLDAGAHLTVGVDTGFEHGVLADTDGVSLEGVPVPHVVRGADDFMQGRVEASTFAIGAGKMAEVDAKVGGIRWLSMPGDPAAEKRVRTIMPAAYIEKLEPAKALVGIAGPTNVIFHDYLIVGGAQMSDDTAYKIAKLLYEQQAKLVAVSKIFGRYKKENLARDHGVPFHPGAIKFYKEVGIWKR